MNAQFLHGNQNQLSFFAYWSGDMGTPKWPGDHVNFQFKEIIVSLGRTIPPFEIYISRPAKPKDTGMRRKNLLVDYQPLTYLPFDRLMNPGYRRQSHILDTALEHNQKPRGPFLALQGIVTYWVLQLSLQKSIQLFYHDSCFRRMDTGSKMVAFNLQRQGGHGYHDGQQVKAVIRIVWLTETCEFD